MTIDFDNFNIVEHIQMLVLCRFCWLTTVMLGLIVGFFCSARRVQDEAVEREDDSQSVTV